MARLEFDTLTPRVTKRGEPVSWTQSRDSQPGIGAASFRTRSPGNNWPTPLFTPPDGIVCMKRASVGEIWLRVRRSSTLCG